MGKILLKKKNLDQIPITILTWPFYLCEVSVAVMRDVEKEEPVSIRTKTVTSNTYSNSCVYI